MLTDLLFGTYRKKVLSQLLLRKTTGAAELLANALLPLQPALALIFGSVASGTEIASSDVDMRAHTH